VEDPLASYVKGSNATISSVVISASIGHVNIFQHENASAFQEGGRPARVALADFAARTLVKQRNQAKKEVDNYVLTLEPLDRIFLKGKRRRQNLSAPYPPYVLERSDIWSSNDHLHLSLRVIVESQPIHFDEKKTEGDFLQTAVNSILASLLPFGQADWTQAAMNHISCVVLQDKIRQQLDSFNAVAFIADNSILPRKSGTSDARMCSPPAVPFQAPPDSSMSQSLTIEMGSLAKYLPSNAFPSQGSSITLSGLVIPKGITLICGGGYHGKSTMLRTIALGVYNKIPGDGREYCIAVEDAVSVRAEDGRYVNNCNISAFISNLPTPPGVTKTVDTEHFSSRDSSGSTSQAANVSEAIEMGCSAMLIDEDVSAANFMARDGRMRALVMDESITPLLYRVNGLYNAKGISSVVVVGGVGDWLDVPHNVVLLDKYVASDATKKAQSISYQFSYGHVQYGGKGVVHRLDWKNSGTPIPRRPTDEFANRFGANIEVSLLDGGHSIALHPHEDDDEMMDGVVLDDDHDEGCIEASRMEQVMGRKQLYTCGLCALWIIKASQQETALGLPELLNKLDETLDSSGLVKVVEDLSSSGLSPKTWQHLVEAVGYAERPRKYEIGQALTRLQGIKFEEIPVEDDGVEAAAKAEEERKKRALAELWAARRKK